MFCVRKGTLFGTPDMGQIGQCSTEIMWPLVAGVLVSTTNYLFSIMSIQTDWHMPP